MVVDNCCRMQESLHREMQAPMELSKPCQKRGTYNLVFNPWAVIGLTTL
jgi:hypothetical protein